MLSCRELVHQTTADPDLLETGHRLPWAVRLHLLMCRHCRRYVRQLKLLLALLARRSATDGRTSAATADRIWSAIERHRGAGP